MGKKSGPKAPPPPDPRVVAEAQGQYNREAAITQANLNRIDQYTPQGNITYQRIGTNEDGSPRYRQDQVYSADQQALYDQQNQVARALGGIAQSGIGRVADAQATPFSYDGMTPLQTTVGGNRPGIAYAGGSTPGVQRSTGDAGRVATTFDGGGSINRSFDTGGPITRNVDGRGVQQGLSFDGLTQLPGTNDFGAEGRRVADSVYEQAASRLNPQFQQSRDDMVAKLANRGIAEGSEAYNREQGNFDRARTDAYGDANFRAIQAGAGEQSRLFGLAMNARQQGANERTSAGQFFNQSQDQEFGQGVTNANLNNQAQGQIFGQGQAAATFGNQAQAQQFGQNQSRATFGNQAQDQQYTQGLGNAELYNNSGQTEMQQRLAALGFDNTARSQGFNEDVTNANFNNAARQQQIQESTYLRNLPLNEIAALLGTGGGVQNPSFNPVAQVGVASPDYQGATYNSFNAQNQQYLEQQRNRSQMLGSIFGTVGSVGGALAMSDRRLKTGIVRIGALASGLATYVYSYIGSKAREFGVMAQDALSVKPDAVVVLPSGYMAVDYRKVW